jgi:hypothetical protein
MDEDRLNKIERIKKALADGTYRERYVNRILPDGRG